MTTKDRFGKKETKKEERGVKHLLQFNVAQLLKDLGSSTRQYKIENADLPPPKNEFKLSKSLNGKVKFIKTDREIFVMGVLETELILPCTRCLTDVEVPITLDIEETFSPTVDVTTGARLSLAEDTDQATTINEQHILDLAEVVRQTIYLNQPTQVLCQETCLGLCPQCGANKNQEPCACEVDSTDVRWADLLALKDTFEN